MNKYIHKLKNYFPFSSPYSKLNELVYFTNIFAYAFPKPLEKIKKVEKDIF